MEGSSHPLHVIAVFFPQGRLALSGHPSQLDIFCHGANVDRRYGLSIAQVAMGVGVFLGVDVAHYVRVERERFPCFDLAQVGQILPKRRVKKRNPALWTVVKVLIYAPVRYALNKR
jgi:hypothetical protein